jgi:hypothetical protein
MSLIKLLTVGRSFVAGQIPTGRYRMVGRQGGLPQFGPTTHSARAPVAHRPPRIPVPCQSEFPKLDLQADGAVSGPAEPIAAPTADADQDRGFAADRNPEPPVSVQPQEDRHGGNDFHPEPARTPDAEGGSSAGEGVRARSRLSSQVPSVEPAAQASSGDRCDRDVSRPTSRSAGRVFHSPFAKTHPADPGLIGRFPKRVGFLQKTFQRLRDWLQPKPGRNSRSPFVGKPVRSPAQAHLKLESVQVMRNDLSDSDYEVRPAGLTGGTAAAEAPALGRARLGVLAASWGQVTARWFESSRARAQIR